MRMRKLTPEEQAFVEANSNFITIRYYPKFAKVHRAKPSLFTIRKGYAFLFSNKIIRKFRKCQVISVIETTESGKDITYPSIKHAIVGGKY